MTDLKELLKEKFRLENQIKDIEEKIKLILEEQEFKEKEFKEEEFKEEEFKEEEFKEEEFKEKEFKEEKFKVDFKEEEEEQEGRIVGDIEELEKELSQFEEIDLDLKLEKSQLKEGFIPAFEDPNDGFEVKNIPYSQGIDNLSNLFNNKDLKINNFF